MSSKKCCSCKVTKSITDFHLNRSRKDGRADGCKPCKKEWARQYYWRNRERLKSYARKKSQVGRRAPLSSATRERGRITALEYYYSPRGQAARKKYIQTPQFKATKKQYRNNRRAQRQSSGGRFTSADWMNLVDHYENLCLSCGKKSESLTTDHIVPLSKGGKNDIGNIQPLCLSCNSSKGTKTIDYRPDKGPRRWAQMKLLDG